MSALTLLLRQWYREVQQRGDATEAARIKTVMDLVNPFTAHLGIAVEPRGRRGDVFTREGDVLKLSAISRSSGLIYHTRIPYSLMRSILAVLYMQFHDKTFSRQELESALQAAGVQSDGKSYCGVLRWLEAEEIIPYMGPGTSTDTPKDLIKRAQTAWENLPLLPPDEGAEEPRVAMG